MTTATLSDIRLLTDKAVSDGGYTIPLTGGKLGRYVVGGLRTATMKVADAMVNAGAVAKRLGELAGAETLGSWLHEGVVYYDLGNTYDDESTAMSAARERGELAIYDTVANRELATR